MTVTIEVELTEESAQELLGWTNIGCPWFLNCNGEVTPRLSETTMSLMNAGLVASSTSSCRSAGGNYYLTKFGKRVQAAIRNAQG